MSSLPQLLALARRTAPFWSLWLLILVLPLPRALLKMQIYKAPFTPGFISGYETDFYDDPRYDAFAAVRNRPGDLNARIWRLAEMRQGRAAGFDAGGERRQQVYPPAEIEREANRIATEFPREKWLFSLPFRVQSLGGRWTSTAPGSSPNAKPGIKPGENKPGAAELARLQPLERLARRAAKIEPDNAFFPLLEADIYHRCGQDALMWQALDRASKCARLDTHELAWARAQVEAHEAVKPLLLEDKEILWQERLGEAWKPADGWHNLLLQSARRAQRAGHHRRALSIAAVLLRLGDLMQRGQNTLPVVGVGQSWKEAAGLLLVRSYPPLPPAIPFPPTAAPRPRGLLKPIYWAPNLAAYAAAHGRADLAPTIKRAQARQNQMLKLAAFAPWSGRWSVPATVSATQKVGQWRAMGAQISAHLLLVAGFWLLLNAVLWRGVGRASTRSERLFPAVVVAALSFGTALWARHNHEAVLMAMLTSRGMGWSPTNMRLEIAVTTVTIFVFCGAPFLLALWAAGATMWRDKADFLKPARIETELRLAPPQVALLRSGPAILCVAALLATLGVWLLFLGLAASDIASFDLLGWLPGRSNGTSIGYTVPTETLLAPLGYCLLLDFLGFLGWLTKWRYGGDKSSRPLLHSGLRRWKEALGVYLVIGSAIYLGTSLGALPLRAAANRELEKRMVSGDLPG